MDTLQVWSGQCCLCDIGVLVEGVVDMHGRDIHTGDIVLIWHGEYVDTEHEQWLPTSDANLSVVVADQYQTYSDGTTLATGQWEPYTMGIRNAGVKSGQWDIQIVKKWSDVVEGEHWTAYGFRYAKADITSKAA